MLLQNLLSIEEVYDLNKPEAFIYLLVITAIFFIGKKVFDWLTPYNLDEELTTHDNKAVAVSFTGYMFGLGVILWGVVSSDEQGHFWQDIIDTAVWGFIGIFLLHIARLINDKLILKNFHNVKELIVDKNIGTGAVECGSYIGSAFIIMGAISGEDSNFTEGVITTLIFFAMGQIGFVLFASLFQGITRYDLHEEIEKDNISAGVGFGMTLTAMGILLSHSLIQSDSLFSFIIWFLLSAALLIVFRYLVDKLILPGSLLDEEIKDDQNWGAALINGSMAIIVALLVNAVY